MIDQPIIRTALIENQHVSLLDAIKQLSNSEPQTPSINGKVDPHYRDRWRTPSALFKDSKDFLRDLILCETTKDLNGTQSRSPQRSCDHIQIICNKFKQPSHIDQTSSSPFRYIRLRVHPHQSDLKKDENTKSPKKEFKPKNKPVQTYLAPGLQDDFYLTLLDWSHNGLLATGIQNDVVIWKPDIVDSQEAISPNVNNNENHGISTSPQLPIPSNSIRLQDGEGMTEPGGASTVASIAWSSNPCNHLGVGRKSGVVELWDVETQTVLRKYYNHQYRVGVMNWFGTVLSSGSRDKSIIHRDIRMPGNAIFRWEKHKQEICGLSWCPPHCGTDGVLASGGNDNNVFIWQLGYDRPIMKLKDHGAAVKALSWCPYSRGVLATGGGTNDRCIRLWDIRKSINDPSNQQYHDNERSLDASYGQLLFSTETGSQVCNLMWSKSTCQLLSTHGFTLNQIILWDLHSLKPQFSDTHRDQSTIPSTTFNDNTSNYSNISNIYYQRTSDNFNYHSELQDSTNRPCAKPSTDLSLQRKEFFEGHSARVLYATMSPDGSTIATGAGDENICLWNLFPSKGNIKNCHQRYMNKRRRSYL